MELFQKILPTLLSGISAGGQYALIALGYTMVYGILRLINFAHGDIFTVAGFVMFYAITAMPLYFGAVFSGKGMGGLEEYGKVEQMPALEGKKMFLYLSPKKAGVAKKSQQKMDRERREAEAKAQSQQTVDEADDAMPAGGGLFANAKNGADALKKLSEGKE